MPGFSASSCAFCLFDSSNASSATESEFASKVGTVGYGVGYSWNIHEMFMDTHGCSWGALWDVHGCYFLDIECNIL